MDVLDGRTRFRTEWHCLSLDGFDRGGQSQLPSFEAELGEDDG